MKKSNFNSLAPGPGRHYFIFKDRFQDWCHEYFLGNCSCGNATEHIDDKSTLVQVMALSHQATSITWASVNIDLCRQMTLPLGSLFDLTHWPLRDFNEISHKQIDDWGISCAILLIWMSLGFTDDKSTLVLVMAWCRQAASHYLSQCWPRFLSPYGVPRPQWVKSLIAGSMALTLICFGLVLLYLFVLLGHHWFRYWAWPSFDAKPVLASHQ